MVSNGLKDNAWIDTMNGHSMGLQVHGEGYIGSPSLQRAVHIPHMGLDVSDIVRRVIGAQRAQGMRPRGGCRQHRLLTQCAVAYISARHGDEDVEDGEDNVDGVGGWNNQHEDGGLRYECGLVAMGTSGRSCRKSE